MDRGGTISERLHQVASACPERVAVVDGTRRLRYRDLERASQVLALRLQERLDLSAGEVLLVWLNNCWEFVVTCLAAAHCGAVCFPLNINWREPELEWIIGRQLPIGGLLTKRALRPPWQMFASRLRANALIAFDDPDEVNLLESASSVPHAPGEGWRVSPDQAAVYFASSGSTGVPKLIPRSHRNLVAGAAATSQALGLQAGFRFLSAVPFYHGNGFDNSLLLPLLSGGTAVLHGQCAVSGLVAALADHRIEVFIGSPAIFELLARFGGDRRTFASLTVCASSGGPLADEIADAIRDRYGVSVRQVYGASETGVIAVSAPGHPSALVPVPGVFVTILGGDGRPCPAYAEGEVAVQGPTVSDGYVGDPEGTAAVLAGGWCRTGDLGFLDAEGRLTLKGRLRPTINLSGTKVDPVEIESVIVTLAGVRACKVLAETSRPPHQILKAVVAVENGAHVSRTDVVAHCRRRLAEYKIPRIIEIVPALPEDWTGKVAVAWKRDRR